LIARAYLVVFSDTTPAMGENGEPEFNLNDPRSIQVQHVSETPPST
jgi:hypothetical protein